MGAASDIAMPDTDVDPPPPQAPTLGQTWWFWLKVGCISFGGPAGQIALLHQELVERRRWISERRFLHALNYCMVLPGPEAQQLATYLGWLLHRSWGGIVAGVLFVLPSLLLLIALSWVYLVFGSTPLVAGLFAGIKPAVTAIVLQAAWRMGTRALRNPVLWALAALSWFCLYLLQAPFPAIVLGAGLVGLVGGQFAPHYFQTGATHKGAAATHGPAVIDDDTAPPAHARFSQRGLLAVLAWGLLLWALPMGLLLLVWGWDHTLTQMAWFFTKAALLTFGGAYAVLPYVYQGAVEHFHWLSAAQMMDGLALGETTPGPLIMVVAFVGYVGGHTQALLGDGARLNGGALAATVATWFTFLPSFVFILGGGPFIESTRKNLRFTAPLAAITAAVVGVIASLALFFAQHLLWPQGMEGQFDVRAALIAAAAAVALIRFQRPVVQVIAACALVGWGLSVLA
jgi:chromate transporter